MPELPEVETIKRELEPIVTGRRITGVDLPWEGIVRQPSAEEFRARLPGNTILKLERDGKYLSFRLSGGDVLIVHLRMTGALLVDPNSPDNKYVRAVIHLEGQDMYFRDPRKFGRMWLVADKNEVVGKLGPDPLDPTFTAARLGGLLHGRNAPVKAVLIEQEIVAGIGNMYADEALFAASIHPTRPAGSLKKEEILKLYGAICQVLAQALIGKGASVQNYYRPRGELGKAHYLFKVAHRRGEKCLVCGGPLQYIKVRGRGTYFCPHCQY